MANAPTPAVPVERSTRERILGLAVQIASNEGLEALTIGRLASEMGMSKSGLFGHFGSKEDLQIATIDEASRIFRSRIIKPALDVPEGAERLRALCKGFVDYLDGSVFEGGCFWGSVSAEFDGRPGPVRDAIRAALGRWVGLLEEQAALAGVDDPKQLAFELHALGQGANSVYQLFGDDAAFDRARRAMEPLLP